jgi:hypothetical protein
MREWRYSSIIFLPRHWMEVRVKCALRPLYTPRYIAFDTYGIGDWMLWKIILASSRNQTHVALPVARHTY